LSSPFVALSLVAHVVLEVVDRGGLSDSGESERARLLHFLNDQREGAWSRLVVSLVAAVVSQYRADRGHTILAVRGCHVTFAT
jgi:hypothetical protein